MERDIVLCPSKEENGKQCGFELISRFKRCPICEVRVEQAWFQSGKLSAIFLFYFKSRFKLTVNLRHILKIVPCKLTEILIKF